MLKPLHGNVLVVTASENLDKKTAGGLFIPGNATPNAQVEGTVEGIGDGAIMADGSRRVMSVKVGDRVLFNKSHAAQVQDDNHFILTEDRLLAIVV